MNRETKDRRFFEQLLLSKATLNSSQRTAKDWEILKKAATTFEQRLLLWGIAPQSSKEETEVWKMIKEKANTFGECRLVWKITPSNLPKKNAVALKRARVKS